MPMYACKCPVCEGVSFKPWGATKCPNCGATMIQSKVEQFDFEKLTNQQQDDLFPGIQEKKAQALAAKELREEEARKHRALMDKLSSIIFTTSDSIEGYQIEKYIGLVGGSSYYVQGGAIGEGYMGHRPDEKYQKAIMDAMNGVKYNANNLPVIPDAVIGIKTNMFPSEVGLQVVLTGTAVVFKK